LQVAGENQVLHVRSANGNSITSRRLLHIAEDFLAEPVPIRQDFFQSHGRQRPPGGQLHVAIQPVLIAGDRVNRRLGIDNRELYQDADPNSHFVGGQDFLTFNGQVAGAHVYQDHFPFGTATEQRKTLARLCQREFVPSSPEHLDQHAILVIQSPMGVFDDDLLEGHVLLP
jgi:hypothetical protein